MSMLTRYCLALAIALAAFPAAGAELDDTQYRRMNQDMVERHILPRYQAFEAATGTLAAAAGACAEAPDALLPAFDAALDAWMAVQHIHTGPVGFGMRGERIHYWPDRRSTGGRQLDQLLAQRPADITQQTLATGSVALQGFPALERVLVGETADGLDAFECGLVTAIAGNLATLGHELVAEWTSPDGEAHTIATAGDPDSFYASAHDVSADIYQAMYEALQIMTEDKVGAPLGESLSDARPRRAELWRSGRSARNLAINLAGVLDLFAGGDGYGYEDALIESGSPELATAIRGTLEEAIAIAEALPMPLADAVLDETARPQVQRLYELVNAARDHVGAELGAALGLNMGFNSLDGD
jgi:uncharacterized protein